MSEVAPHLLARFSKDLLFWCWADFLHGMDWCFQLLLASISLARWHHGHFWEWHGWGFPFWGIQTCVYFVSKHTVPFWPQNRTSLKPMYLGVAHFQAYLTTLPSSSYRAGQISLSRDCWCLLTSSGVLGSCHTTGAVRLVGCEAWSSGEPQAYGMARVWGTGLREQCLCTSSSSTSSQLYLWVFQRSDLKLPLYCRSDILICG